MHELDTEQPQLPTAREIQSMRRWCQLAIVVALLASGLSYLISTDVSGSSVGKIKNARYLSCQDRNKQNTQLAANQRSQYAPLLADAKASKLPDPVLIQVLGALATTQPSIVVCTR